MQAVSSKQLAASSKVKSREKNNFLDLKALTLTTVVSFISRCPAVSTFINLSRFHIIIVNHT